MLSKLTIRDSDLFLKRYSLISLILNLILLILSVPYYLGNRISIYGLILGILFLFTILYNLGLIIYSDKFLKKKTYGPLGKRIHYLSYIYLISLILGLLTFISRYGEFMIDSLSIIIFYILIGFSAFMARSHLSILKNKDLQDNLSPRTKVIKILKIILGICCVLFFIICSILAWGLLTGGPPLIGIVTGSIISLISGLLILIVPVVTVLFLKLFRKKSHTKFKAGIIIVGISFTGIFALPYVSIPSTIYDANLQFTEHFGADWNDFNTEVEKHFLDMPFVFGHLYFGLPVIDDDNYKVKRDITYVKTKDYELKYDVYYPDKKDLPGEDATIIYIHGGGWSSGDKNQHPYLIQYLAAQGYHLFDIQYRLIDLNFVKELSGIDVSYMPPDEDLVGDYTIEDQISDVANFTRYLYLNNDYNANLENVFFIGNSAGGHLAGLASFGYNEGYWNFSQYLNITGTVLFYPANDAEYFFYGIRGFYDHGFIPGDKTPKEDPDLYDKYTPSELVDEDDPPCLIFHGTSDQLVPISNSYTIKNELLEDDVTCILVRGYFGAHGHTEATNYLTVAIYYMERFLFLLS